MKEAGAGSPAIVRVSPGQLMLGLEGMRFAPCNVEEL